MYEAESTDVGPGLGWAGAASWGSADHTRALGSHVPHVPLGEPRGLNPMGGMGTLPRTAGAGSQVLGSSHCGGP